MRGYWIAEELAKKGISCNLLPQTRRIDLFTLLVHTIRSKAVIFQKTYGKYHYWLQLVARTLGRKTYIDIDDAPSINNNERTLKQVAKMMQAADAVFAGSENLQKWSSQYNSNVLLVPSSINLDQYSAKALITGHTERPICIGWIGNGKFYSEDLIQILKPAISILAQRHQIHLKLVGTNYTTSIGAAFENVKGLQLECIDELEWSNTDAVLEQIRSFDIGVYPLIPKKFNEFKCGFKALEYMALAIPVVSSDVANNASIIRHEKAGYIAYTTEDWVKYLEKLVIEKQLREQFGSNGRKRVESAFSTAKSADQIRQVIESKS